MKSRRIRKGQLRRSLKGGRKLKKSANCNTVDKIKTSVKYCLKKHNAEPVSDCSLIFIDTKTLGSLGFPMNDIIKIYDDILLNYDISMHSIYLFNDLKAIYKCYTHLHSSNNFLQKALHDDTCQILNRKLNPKQNFDELKPKIELFLHFLDIIKDNSELLENKTIEEIVTNIDTYFKEFIKSSLEKIKTGNLIMAMYGHGGMDKTFALVGNGAKTIDPESLHVQIADGINKAESVVNLFIIPNQCFSASFYDAFVTVDDKPETSIGANIIIIQYNTFFITLDIIQELETMKLMDKSYNEIKNDEYQGIKISDLIDEDAYNSDFFSYDDVCRTSVSQDLSEIYSILISIAERKFATSEDILKELRDNVFDRYLDATLDGPLHGTPFFSKGYYKKHPIFIEQLKTQLVTTRIKEESMFVDYFNKLVPTV